MAQLVTTYSEKRQLRLALALQLFDQFTGKRELTGRMTVRVADKPKVKPFVPFLKEDGATFLFFELPDGDYKIEVRSDEAKPYYLARDISITLPMPNPRWPAFPDVTLADKDKPLDDPAQPAAYRTQRAAATLQPTTAYPFPEGTTLVRGTVRTGTSVLSQAALQPLGPDFADVKIYVTGEDGEYVLFFPKLKGSKQTVTLRATHASHPPFDQQVEVRREMTVTQNIDFP
jgi:hypothetical protein